ncbi:hypothetical protein MLD38_006170 [Melastoma candidum]|uniref:Uncharacterized protein n=1 Tax=Melastoma candidum TaxID=119954 RepID=A0ACB9RM28_9MYRT|nr:hypothetical protein MLD38_006170 [Melastoma candidum]
MGIPSDDVGDKAFNGPQISTTQEGVREGVKAACVACVVAAIPTMAAVRFIPWAKANLNYTAQALIVSGASVAAFFIAADKTILEHARSNARYDRTA